MPSQENDAQNRLQAFKNKGKNADEMRRRRCEVTTELRKARKDEQLLKRRNIADFGEPVSPLQENNSQTPIPMTIPEIVEGMASSDENVLLSATQAARKTLSRERNPPIDAMINSGIVPRCVEFLSFFHKYVESVLIEIPMPKSVLNCSLTPNQGKYSFDPVSKVLLWDVGRIDTSKLPNLRGTINLQTGAPAVEANPAINVQFVIGQLAVSGLKVNRLDMYGEKYKPFKGVKYITKAGRFQIRM